ncbi:MAG: Ig-like domain-containing protein, partial [Clostridia bacterium]|nr:Ig-like domain-containing protein [Clostridia bacterium]
MKKTTKILSSLLACVMIISALPVFASASDEIPNAFFCDFESITPIVGGDATTAGELTAAGFKWVADANTAKNFKIINDETYGNTLGFKGTGSIGVAFDTPVTTGKVRIGFSCKAGTFAYIRPIGALGSAQSSTGTNIEVDGEKILYFGQVTNSGFDVLQGQTYSDKTATKTLSAETWYYIEFVVDLDNNSWTGYVNGELVATTEKPLTSANSMDPLPQLQGFYFYNGNSGDRTGLVDNVVMSYESDGRMGASVLATDYTADADGGQIEICFSEALKSTADIDDIKFIKCGASDEISVSDISILHNRMTINYSEALDEGCEYAVTFGESVETLSGKGIDGAAYVYRKPESQKVIYYAGSEDAAEGFDDTTGYTTFTGSLGTRMQVNNTDYLNAFHMQTESITGDNAYVAYVSRADCSFAPPEGTTDYALSPFSSSKAYRLLDMIPGDSGIETYEFEVKNIGDSPLKIYALINDEYTDDYTNASYGWQIASMSKNNNWRKIKLVY